MTYAVRSATVRFRHTLALDDVSVEVPRGSVVAVVGGDGAGKSTLLRALAGEVRLDEGTVDAPQRQRLGYLPASSGSWAALTVTQNIDFVAGIYGLAGGGGEGSAFAVVVPAIRDSHLQPSAHCGQRRGNAPLWRRYRAGKNLV